MPSTYNKSPKLSSFKAFCTVIILLLWIVGLVLALAKTQAESSTTPVLLIHSSGLLLLLLAVKIFAGQWRIDLAICPSRFVFLVLAVFLGFAYWQCQQFISALYNPYFWQQSAMLWQQAQAGFTIWSVFIASCLVAPLFEEMLFRGLIYTQLKHNAGYFLAILISSGLFTLLHWDLHEAAWLFAAGIMYAILREKSGSIWPPVIAHMIQNVLTFLLYVSI